VTGGSLVVVLLPPTSVGAPAPGARALTLPLRVSSEPGARPARVPPLRAPSWIAVDAASGHVLAEHRPSQRRRIGSTTKLMTALITLRRVSLHRRFTAIGYRAGGAETVVGLRRGERVRVSDLLRALLLPSANDAAATLAVRVAHSARRFVRLMNGRARRLGLSHTHYANPIGLDAPGNYSTAHDLVRLARVDLRDRFFARTVARPSARVRLGKRTVVVHNLNTLVGAFPWVRGVKPGHTARAGYVLVGLGVRHSGRVLSAVMAEPSQQAQNADTLSLLRYGLAHVARDPTIPRGEPLARVDLRYRAGQHVDLVAGRSVGYALAPGEHAFLTLTGVPGELNGPLPAGAAEGSAVVHAGGRVVARVPLVTAQPIAAASLGQRLRDYFTRAWTLALLGGLLACSLLLVLLRRRARRRGRAGMEGRPGSEVA